MPQKYKKSKAGRRLTYWQELVSRHGIKKAKRLYSGYRQRAGKLSYKGDRTRDQDAKTGIYRNTGDLNPQSRAMDLGKTTYTKKDGGIGHISPAMVKPGRVGAGVNEEEAWEMDLPSRKGLLGGLLG